MAGRQIGWLVGWLVDFGLNGISVLYSVFGILCYLGSLQMHIIMYYAINTKLRARANRNGRH